MDEPDDEAPSGLSLGAILGGGPSGAEAPLRSVALRVQAARSSHSSDFALNVVFQVPGSDLRPDFKGVRLARVFTAPPGMIAQVAVPDSIDPADVERFALGSIEAAIDLADECVAERKLGWSSAGLRATLADVRSSGGQLPVDRARRNDEPLPT